VEYRGIRYTVHARIEREQWYVAIHPASVEMNGRVVIGSRSDAELQARAMINGWLKKDSTQKPGLATQVMELAPADAGCQRYGIHSHSRGSHAHMRNLRQ
jgi:hypothetical protein